MVFSPVTCNVLAENSRTPEKQKKKNFPQKPISSSVALSQMKDRFSLIRALVSVGIQPAGWWMNVNVIKQFSVYLKLQTFHPMFALPGGRRRKQKITTYKNCFSSTTMRHCQGGKLFFFAFKILLLRRRKKIPSLLWDFMCMSISHLFLS